MRHFLFFRCTYKLNVALWRHLRLIAWNVQSNLRAELSFVALTLLNGKRTVVQESVCKVENQIIRILLGFFVILFQQNCI